MNFVRTAVHMKSVWWWALVGGCAFLAKHFLKDASDAWILAFSAAMIFLLGALRARRAASGVVWACAYLLAASLVGVHVDYVVYRWLVVLLLTGLLAGFFEPPLRDRNRLLNSGAWAIALPVGLYAGIAAAIFLNVPLNAILDSGYVYGFGLGGAFGAVVAYGLGEKLGGWIYSRLTGARQQHLPVLG